jgi:hypothetical protein
VAAFVKQIPFSEHVNALVQHCLDSGRPMVERIDREVELGIRKEIFEGYVYAAIIRSLHSNLTTIVIENVN